MSFALGATMVAVVLGCNMLVAYFTEEDGSIFSEAPPLTGCSNAGNFTQCGDVPKTSFFAQVVDVSVTGIDDMAPEFNLAYVFVTGCLLAIGVLVAIKAWVPFLN